MTAVTQTPSANNVPKADSAGKIAAGWIDYGVVGALTATSITDSGLTSGRVPYASTAGLLADSAALTFVVSTQFLSVGDGTGNALFAINGRGTPNASRDLYWQSVAVNRWIARCSGNETGSDVGSDWSLIARHDDGTSIDNVIGVARAAGGLMTISRPISGTSTTDATSAITGALITAGGVGIAKTLIAAKGHGFGTTSTATAAGTTTLVQGSTMVQFFTGSTTQTIQFPAANLWGAGIAVTYVIVNLSSGSVTPTRAGSDTFQGGGTTDTVTAGTTKIYMSDGVSVWGIR
jgi:hypothetical protein